MRCLSPSNIIQFDSCGNGRTVQVPCGHCIACLHNQQDAWSIRIHETARHHSSFIYDTLTFSNANIPYREVGFFNKDLDLLSEDSLNIIDKNYLFENLETGELFYKIPDVKKKLIQNWIKRGRENYYNVHGVRLKFKYFVVMEYGPRTSRPHFHCLFFGLDKPTYNEYFAKPWRKDYGFTKTKVIQGTSDKDRSCIARYVSKYISKGVFESPLVKEGLCDKPFRCISHGIGEEYIDSPCFQWLKDSKLFQDEINYKRWEELPNFANHPVVYYKYLSEIPEIYLKNLSCYYDNLGNPHALPRYYFYKLFGYEKNFAKFAVQKYLLLLRTKRAKDDFCEFCENKGYPEPIVKLDPNEGFRVFGSQRAHCEYDAFKRRQAETKGYERYILLKNHYKRSFNLEFC